MNGLVLEANKKMTDLKESFRPSIRVLMTREFRMSNLSAPSTPPFNPIMPRNGQSLQTSSVQLTQLVKSAMSNTAVRH